MYKRILLKLSGEALSAKDHPFSMDTLNSMAAQIKAISELGTQVGIVVGGGNICRGGHFATLGLNREYADYIGMEATLINAQMLCAALNSVGCKAKVLSAISCTRVEDYSIEKAQAYLDEGYVVVFGGGTGKPFCSTDTASALRASEIKAEVIMMAKSGVDGVYTADPKKDPNAKRYNEMSFNDIITNELGVIDLSAARMCLDNGVKAFIFNMNDPEDNIVRAVEGRAIGTIII